MPKLSTIVIFLLGWSSLTAQVSSPVTAAAVYDTRKSVIVDSAAVVSPHPLATRVGVEVMRKGGNAIDAAVAVQFAIAVIYPRAGNIGGGGLMVIREANGETAALDYREKAPAAASRDMYLDAAGNPVEGLSTDGHLAAGVPGTVAGLVEAHKRYGQLRWEELLQPAIELAAKGFAITAAEAERLRNFQGDFRAYNDEGCVFIRNNWQEGDRLVQRDLAAALVRIQQRGHDGFYRGETASLIVNEMREGGGFITARDLKEYRAQWRTPVSGYYRGYKVISMPPPSSGGVALLQMLAACEPYPVASYGFQQPAAVHLVVEAARRAYADRAAWLGDTDYFPVPVNSLTDTAYVRMRMRTFDPAHASPSDSIAGGKVTLLKESFETTHTSVVDPSGNAVSVTTTLNSNYGCKVVVDGAGFFLNNEMDDFSVKPGVPNQFGLVGSEANAIEPGKRMLSSMTPTIVEKDGRLFMLLGAPGGSTIITSVLQVIMNVIDFGMPLDKAIHAARFHHQWLPDEIMVERNAITAADRAAMEAMGHRFREVKSLAVVKAIHVRADGKLQAAGDHRNPDDHAAGW
jgi:gamma-glutamyltranspeptidase/glutathione hydrolase